MPAETVTLCGGPSGRAVGGGHRGIPTERNLAVLGAFPRPHALPPPVLHPPHVPSMHSLHVPLGRGRRQEAGCGLYWQLSPLSQAGAG